MAKKSAKRPAKPSRPIAAKRTAAKSNKRPAARPAKPLAKKLLARLMASPSGLLVLAPKPPELASRALAQLHEAGWRPTLATERKAV